MGRKTTSKEYQARYKAIKGYVDWKIPKTLSRIDKQKVTKAYRAIAKVMRGGAAIVRSKSKDRVAKANKIAGMRVKGLKVAFVRNTVSGSKVSLDKHGQAIEKIGKIRRLTLEATFFYRFEYIQEGMDDVEARAAEEKLYQDAQKEADRLLGVSNGASSYAIKYAAGGESDTFTRDVLSANLVVGGDVDYKYNPSAGPSAIVAYWIPRKNVKKIIEIKAKQKEKRKKARKRWSS